MAPGLKEGGHHRKALDLAAKKKKEKQADKDARVAAGARGQILAQLLKQDPNVDIYLEAAADDDGDDDDGHHSNSRNSYSRTLCRTHFLHEDCSNRRCKLSHEYTIADATTAASSSDTTSNSSGAMPALELVPGLLGISSSSSSCRPVRKQKRRPMRAPQAGAAGLMEELPGFVASLEFIVAFLPHDNTDAFNLMRTCRFVRASLTDCWEVMRRRRAMMDRLLQQRNQRLLGKATAARLRYAVSYQTNNSSRNNSAMNSKTTTTNETANSEKYDDDGKKDGNKPKHKNAKKKKGKKKSSGGGKNGAAATVYVCRPTLAYDYENAAVFRSFYGRVLSS